MCFIHCVSEPPKETLDRRSAVDLLFDWFASSEDVNEQFRKVKNVMQSNPTNYTKAIIYECFSRNTSQLYQFLTSEIFMGTGNDVGSHRINGIQEHLYHYSIFLQYQFLQMLAESTNMTTVKWDRLMDTISRILEVEAVVMRRGRSDAKKGLFTSPFLISSAFFS